MIGRQRIYALVAKYNKLLPAEDGREDYIQAQDILRIIPIYFAENRQSEIMNQLGFLQAILWRNRLLTLQEITEDLKPDPMDSMDLLIQQVGGFRRSRFKIRRHRFGVSADESFFAEVLEILNPPEKMGRFYVYEFKLGDPYQAYEFNSLATAIAAWEKIHIGLEDSCAQVRYFPGFVLGYTSQYRPWFFALPHEEIDGLRVKEITPFVSPV